MSPATFVALFLIVICIVLIVVASAIIDLCERAIKELEKRK